MKSHGRQATLRGVVMECREIGVGWYNHVDSKDSSKEYYTLRYAKHAVPQLYVEQIPPHNATGAYHST